MGEHTEQRGSAFRSAFSIRSLLGMEADNTSVKKSGYERQELSLTSPLPYVHSGLVPSPHSTHRTFHHIAHKETRERTEQKTPDSTSKENSQETHFYNSRIPSPLESDISDRNSDNDDDEKMSSDADDQESDYFGSDRKKKKTRTVFSRRQIFELEAMFDMKRYLTSSERSRLAQGLQMTETQVKIWFQNRRNKWKRQLAENEPPSQYSYGKTEYVVPGLGIHKSISPIQNLVAPHSLFYSDHRLRKCLPLMYGQPTIELTHL